MEVDRRGFLIAAGVAALSPLLLASRRTVAAVSAAAPVFRPEPGSSGSASVCARCGSPDHHLLSGGCPQDDRARGAVQAAARGKAAV